MRRSPVVARVLLVVVALATLFGSARPSGAQGRFLAKEDIVLLGLGMRVEPEYQVVPKDIATIVGTFLSAATPPGDALSPFAPDAVVRATLRGPGAPDGLEITALPNSPLNIPPLSVPGLYTLEDIRLESGGAVLMRGTPESVRLEVIEKLLVTQVTARPLTAQEIREKGIVFDTSSFQAYNFTAAFAVQDTPVQVNFPVVLPSLRGAQDITLDGASLGPINTIPTLPELKTIIPDTLRLQTQIPNLKVVGFTLKVPELKGQTLIVPPIPGVVVIPGDIGFLNQFFSVMLMVGNVAPPGSNLVVSNLTGEILLPVGQDTVVGSGDDPLRMATTTGGVSPKVRLVVQPGPDGRLGTADDVGSLGPGESGSAEYLVEGMREGTHVIEFNISGTLTGLPVGPVTVNGRAAGSVLVRNPNFTLTFTHPDTVAAGEPYSLDVTVTNTSESPANFVSLNLFAQNISGASLVGDASREIESIPPGDSATVTFSLVSRVAGRVTAATLDSNENVAGRFALKTAIGELGVPVSPDSLVLPREAAAVPIDVRSAALGLLGKAWAVATAPAIALPKDVRRFSKQVVFDRAVQVAEAGVRISLHEAVPDSVAQLAMDFVGSDAGRLATLYPNVSDRDFARRDLEGFDELRRRSVRGDVFAAAVAAQLGPVLGAMGGAAFHRQFAEKTSYRPPQLSVLVTAAAGQLPVRPELVDALGRRIGALDANGKVIKDVPFGDAFDFTDGSGALTGRLFLLAVPEPGESRLTFGALAAVPSGAFSVSVVVPDGQGGLRQVVYDGLTVDRGIQSAFTGVEPFRVSLDLPVVSNGSGAPVPAAADAAIVPPPLSIIGVVQQADKDVLSCTIGGAAVQVGRVIGVLFSEEVTPQSVQDRLAASEISSFLVDGNVVVGVALQPGRRVAFLALRDPIGPFVARSLTVQGIADARGRAMSSQTLPIETTVTDSAALVSGLVMGADGAPLPFASVRLFVWHPCGFLQGVSSKVADADGRYSWDWVPNTPRNRVAAVSADASQSKAVDFTSQRNGQRLNVTVVFVGRGTVAGYTRDANGTPLAGATVRVTSLTDDSSYGAVTDGTGYFAIPRVPVGNVFIEAVHTPTNAKGSAAELLPLANATVTRNVTLFSIVLPDTKVRYGDVTGFVLRADGASPAADVPVVAYYQNGSQPGVACPQGLPECAIGLTRTDATGRFELRRISAGQIRLDSFDQLTYQQGDGRITLTADAEVSLRILLSKGLATVNGSVLDASGQPVAGARVGGGLSITTTGSDGRFTLADVPVGKVTLVAVSDALNSRGSALIDIAQAGQLVSAAIVLEAVGSVAGTVYRADGTTPVPGNMVYLFRNVGTAEGLAIEVIASMRTDGQGRYRFDGVPARPDAGISVSSFLPDFSDGNLRPVTLRFNGQVFRADLVFRGGGGRVRGRVLDADGQTPLRASVGITADRVDIAGGLVGVGFRSVSNYEIAESNLATGEYSFSGLFVGPFTVTAVGRFSPDPIALQSRVPSPGATVQLDLRLQDTSRIEGTVFQPDGVTPVGANVVVRYRSAEFRTVCATAGDIVIGPITIRAGECDDVPQGIQDETVVTDASGHFLVPLVNAGAFTLTATDPDSGRTAQITGSVRPGQTGAFSLRLLGVGSLRINVRGSNTTTLIPGARVTVTQVAFPKKTFTGVADANGTLLLDGADGFSEGDVVVSAVDLRNGFAGRASGRVTSDGQQVTIPVYLFNASGSIDGRVFRTDGVTPAPFVEVVVSNCVPDPSFIGSGPAPCLSGGPLAFAVADGEGRFTMDLMPLGSFRVDVFNNATGRRGYQAGRIDLDQQVVPVTIVEASRGLVTGTLLAENNLEPLPNWEVWLIQNAPGGRQLPFLRTTSDVDGTFAFPGVVAGPFQLQASRTTLLPGDPYGQGSASARLDQEGQRVDVPLLARVIRQQRGTVDGSVVNPDGSPARDISIDLCPVSTCAQDRPGPGHLRAVTGDDGRFFFSGVPTGRFVITAVSQTSFNQASARGELQFEGDTAQLSLILSGTSLVSGTVVFGNGAPAANVQVLFSGTPSSGCPGFACAGFTDAAGAFAFPNITARTYYVIATDPVSGLSGFISGTLNPGSAPTLRIVLQATGSVTGRALFADGRPAPGITAELSAFGSAPIYRESGDDGAFAFPAVALGTYTLRLEDPIGSGIARREVAVNGAVALGDVTLDDAPPSVATLTPLASAVGVPLASTIRIVFSEPVSVGTVNQATVRVAGPAGPVLGTLQVSGGDTTATFTPLAPLQQQSRYTVALEGVTDRIGKPIVPFSASFTTVDLTPPAVIDLSPAVNGNGAPLASTIRVKYSEPINPALFRGPPVTLSASGTQLAGRTDVTLGNTVVVFTPALPLAENTLYQVQLGAAVDLAGNEQPSGFTYEFRSYDRTPPQITALRPAGTGTVIENGITSVVADVGAGQDIALVDFFINDQPAAAARTAPFTLSFQATAQLGRPGEAVRVAALATDTSGNRGTMPVSVVIPIVADAPPVVAITTPASGATFRTGDRVTVTLRATDDLGATQLAYRAQTGRAQDAGTTGVSPASADVTRTFAFSLGSDVVPGSTITINASATDTKGQTTNAPPITITVADATPPTVQITGTTTGASVAPGQQSSAIVAAQDLGGIASITFTTSGAVAGSDTRTIAPVQNSVAAAFAFTVPATARAGDTVTLDATAVDAAGNTTSAARVILPIADRSGPTLRLRTANGGADVLPGTTLAIVAEGEDETGVSTVAVSGQGAFSFAQSRQISPVSNSIQQTFQVPVPAGLADGGVIDVVGTATDIFGNVSQPATLRLTVRSQVDVALPASVLIAAGDTAGVEVGLSAPAPAGGLIVDLASSNAAIAQVSPQLSFAAGETMRTAALTGVTGGTATLQARVNGVDRGSTVVTVRGGIVRGIIRNLQLQPVAGASVTVAGGDGVVFNTTSGPDGAYLVAGVGLAGYTPTTFFTVRVSEPVTQRIGFATGMLSAPAGHATVDVVLVSAGTISGAVRHPNGTAAGAGVRVDLLPAANLVQPLATTFTGESGTFEFPLVSPGEYVVEASDVSGNRGRSNALVINASGQVLDAPVTFLGRSTVSGRVLDGSGNVVPNVPLTFSSTSLFGPAASVATNAGPDGTFRFEGVFVGSFTVAARDPLTNLAGSTAGTVDTDGQVVTADVRIAASANLRGTLYRADGTTPVAGARVTVYGAASATVTTDGGGAFSVAALPLGPYLLEAREPSTRGFARTQVTLGTSGETVTQDLRFFPQGTLLVSVVDANGSPIGGGQLRVSSATALAGDTIDVVGNATGTTIVEWVLASETVAVSASAGGLSGSIITSLQPDEIKAVTVRLEPTATIAGTVFLPDGQTPAAGVTVFCGGCGSVVTDDVGRYEFAGLRLFTWSLEVRDQSNMRRALARDVSLRQAGEIRGVDLTMVGLGTVTGRVLNPDNSSAPNLRAEVRSLDPDLGGYFEALTDGGGFYRVERVPVGAIGVSVADRPRGLLGEAAGTLARDGDTLNLDVLLRNNAVTLPQTRQDGNQFTFDVQANGSLAQGQGSIFQLPTYYGDPGGAMLLDIVRGATSARFAGSAIGTTEANGRELVVSQANINGLNVSRKVLVSSAYFARYLELLTNPTSAPITVDVRLQTNLRATGAFATSSGDAAVDVVDSQAPDRWIAMNGAPDEDPFRLPFNSFGLPQVGFAFAGPGAATPPTLGTFTVRPLGSSGALTYGWSNVTIQPGATVAFMHFGVQQYSRAALQASLERLVQVPPEALESLSPAELAAIRNFATAADGTSAVPALPARGGSVTGRLLEADGSTPVPTVSAAAGVRLRSSVVLFGRTYHAGTNSTGTFSFATDTLGTAFSFPLAPFSLEADHRMTNVVSPSVAGAFAPATATASTDVVFSNTALVRGLVRRTSGAVVAGARITFAAPAFAGGTFPPSTAAGVYAAGGLPPQAYTVTASIPHPQGVNFRLSGAAAVALAAGDVRTQDVTLQPTGAVTGVVRTAAGALAVNTPVELRGASVFGDNFTYLSTVTDSSGIYRFVDAPLGTLTVRTVDPVSRYATTVPVTVVQDQTSTADLVLGAVGSIDLTVNYANGQPVANASVEIQIAAMDTYFRYVASTNAAGRATIPNVAGGAFIVRVSRPNSLVKVDTIGSITSNGQVLPLTVVLPPVGSLAIQVTTRAGVPVDQAFVEANLYSSDFFSYLGYTDASGRLTVPQVNGPSPLLIRATSSTTGSSRQVSAAITAEGQVLDVPIVVDAQGSVSGTVTTEGGVPLPGTQVLVFSESNSFTAAVQADGLGRYQVNAFPTGTFRVRVQDFTTQRFGATEGMLAADGATVTADVDVNGSMLPAAVTDANGTGYNVLTDGASASNAAAFGRYPTVSVSRALADSFTSFAGDAGAARELDGRQLAVRNFDNRQIRPASLAGLTVVRRTFVDPSGYFVRHLDTFFNPTAGPVTVDIEALGISNASRVLASSSGDTAVSPDDTWFTVDDPRRTGIVPSAIVMQGPGAAAAMTSTQLWSDPYNNNGSYFVRARWSRITVQPGERVNLLQFVAAAGDAATAQAVAERLVQLPPEALAGLTAADASRVINFVVPADLSSPLPAFGAVTGRVFAAGLALPGAQVTVTGSAPVFGPTVRVNADAAGAFTARTLDDGPFSVRARNPITNEQSDEVPLVRTPGQPQVTQDLLIGNLGILRGTVRFARGTPTPFAQVSISGGVLGSAVTSTAGADGTFSVALPAGDYTIYASAGSRYASAAATVSVGQEALVALTLNAVAILRVTVTRVDGTPLAYVPLQIFQGGNWSYYPFYTDQNGVATLQVVQGPFTIQLQTTYETCSGAVAASDDGATIDLPCVSGAASVRGTVRFANGTPVGGGYVQIGSRSATINADGTYLIESLAPGTYTAYATVNGATTEAPFTLVPGQDAVLDIRFPGFATVRLTVRANGAPLTTAYAYVSDATGYRFAGYVDANGQLLIANVREGAFTLFVYSYGTVPLSVTRAGVVTATNVANNEVVDVLVDSIAGTASGYVYAADGTTPAPSVLVLLLDDATGTSLAAAFTNQAGFYQVSTSSDSGAVRVRAQSPMDPSIVAEGTGSFATNPSLTIDLTLPVGILRGRVLQADGTTPAAAARVEAAQARENSDPATTTAYTDALGVFVIVGPLQGPVSLLATSGESPLLIGRAEASVAAVTTVAAQDVVLAPFGTITGVVRDASGAPVQYADLAVTTEVLDATRPLYGQTDVDGTFSLTGVPVGGFAVQACLYDGTTGVYACGAARGTVAGAGSTAVVEVVLPAFGQVTGTVYAADGITPAPDAWVTVTAGADGPNGAFSEWVRADASGTYSLDNVPAGPVTVAALDGSTFNAVGVSFGQLTAAAPLSLDVRQSGAFDACRTPLVRPGSGGLSYDFDCLGLLRDGGTTDRRLTGPFVYPFGPKLAVNGQALESNTPARRAADGSGMELGPWNLGGLTVSRAVFVADSGGFARYVDTLTNTTGTSATVTVTVRSAVAGPVDLLVGPAATGGRYAILKPGTTATATRPLVGFVFAGAQAGASATGLQFPRLIGSSGYQYRLTIPAGESVSVLHFLLQRDPTDVAGAQAQAEVLATLADPAALIGLTAAERARIINFAVQ